MKKWSSRFLAAVCMGVLALCLCVGCGDDTGTKTVQGRVAVLLADAALEEAYTGSEVSEGKYSWYDMEEEVSLAAGDIVLLLQKEEDGRSRVLLPYGEQPFVHGYVSGDLLTREQEVIKTGNQAHVMGAWIYDAPRGKPLWRASVGFEIARREDGWAKGVPMGCDWEPFWVKEEDLFFGFHGQYYDRG